MWGDPHLITFDNVSYDFQASGDFVLSRATDGPDYEVQARFVELSSAASITEAIGTSVAGKTVSVEANGEEGILLIDGQATAIADGNSVTVGAGSISRNGQRYDIDYGNGDTTSVDVFSSFLNVSPLPSGTRAPGSFEGLFGNGDNNPSNDFQLADGTPLSTPLPVDILYGDYAQSWLVEDNDSLLPGTAEEYAAPERVLTIDSLPQSLRQAAEDVVNAAGITNPILRDAAILDFALTQNEEFIEAARITDATFDPIIDTVAVDPVVSPAVILTSDLTELSEEDTTARKATLTVARGSTTGDLTVRYDIEGVGINPISPDDLVNGITSGEVTIADGTDSAKFEVEIVDDLLIEETETFDVKISLDDTQSSNFEILSSSVRFNVESNDKGSFIAVDAVDDAGDIFA
ncbi:MAG: VWD domain-containing protein, partial [Bacteroidota bacterium]